MRFEAQDVVPHLGTILAELRFSMKLMGISKLADLKHHAVDALDGAVRALVAELEAGAWRSIGEIAESFPAASIDGIKVRIPLVEGHQADLLVDCEMQMILIEYAGAGTGTRANKTGSKAA